MNLAADAHDDGPRCDLQHTTGPARQPIVGLLRRYGAFLSIALAIGCGSDEPDDPGTPPCEPSRIDGRIGSGSWDPGFTIAGLTGYDGYTPAVHSLVSAPDGGVVAAGYFLWAGAERVGPLARLRDGAWQAARRDITAPDVATVAIDGSRFAIVTFAPLLPVVAAPPQIGEIFVDAGGGLAAIGSFQGIVRQLAWVGDELWAAGYFQLDGGGPMHLAVWNGTAWSPAPGGAPNGPVYELLVEADAVYAAGSFSQIGGIDAQSVAEWTAGQWRPYSMQGLEPAPYGAFVGPVVYGLTRGQDGSLIAGGLFFPPGDPTAGGVARWTGTEWQIVGDGFAVSGGISDDTAGVVSDVVVHGGSLYAGGCFSRTGGDPARPLPGVARWTGTGWEAPAGSDPGPLASAWFQPWACGSEPSGTAILEAQIQTLHSDGTLLYVGGAFDGISGAVPSKALIAHDGARWVALGTPGDGLVGAASELAVGGPACSLHAFGGMSHAGSASGGTVYRFGDGAWSALGGPLPDDVTCSQLAVSEEGAVYVGCETEFTADTAPVPRVFRRNGDAWVALPEPAGVRGGLSIGDMAFDPAGRLWLAGGEGEAGFLIRWDGEHVGMVETGFDGTVTRIAFTPGASSALVAGGGFTHVGTVEVNGVARFDGSTWTAFGAGLEAPLESPVSALAATEDAVYVSTHAGASGHAILARWNGTIWEELGVPERGLPPHSNPQAPRGHQFYRLWARGDHVVAAGSAFPVSGGRNVFVFDGERFSPLGGGVGAISVDAFAATPDALWFGGTIATTGADATLAPSIGVARFELGAASP